MGCSVRDGLGDGLWVERVNVGGGTEGQGLEFDLLDGAIGVENDRGNWVVGSGTEVEKRTG